MEKELKELSLKLKAAGLKKEANRLAKFAKDDLSIGDYYIHFKDGDHKVGKEVLESIKDFFASDVYDFIIDNKDTMNTFCSQLYDFITNGDSGEFEQILKFNPNGDAHPKVAHSDFSYIDKSLSSDQSVEIDGQQFTADLYLGYKNYGKPAGKINLGFTTYYFRKGDSTLYGNWISLSQRKPNEAAVREFLESDSGADKDGKDLTVQAYFKTLLKEHKENQEYRSSSSSSATVTFTPPTITSYTTRVTRGTVKPGDKSPEVKQVQRALIDKGYLKSGNDDSAFGPTTARAIFNATGENSTLSGFNTSAIIAKINTAAAGVAPVGNNRPRTRSSSGRGRAKTQSTSIPTELFI